MQVYTCHAIFKAIIKAGHQPVCIDINYSFQLDIEDLKNKLDPGEIIHHGVTIGECSVIGAGSIVTKDIPPFSIAIGSPAKVISKIDKNAL